MVERIALVGMMGVGKTTVGKILAENLGCPYVDLDAAIEQALKMSIPDVFAIRGEGFFRNAELSELRRVSGTQADSRLVLGSGGGIVTSESCRKILSSEWYTVWLKASPGVLYQRLIGETASRPMISSGTEHLLAALGQLAAEREQWYRDCSMAAICVDDLTPYDAAQQIISLTKQVGFN